jgi:uncharacterized protein YndB with AHSA1/START domain
MTMSAARLELTAVPSVNVGMLIRREPAAVFEAIVNPEITSKIWYTKSSGTMLPGARLRWEWEMYAASSDIVVKEVEDNRRVSFSWSGYSPDNPTTVEFRFTPRAGGTYVQVTESGLTGTGDELARHAADSTEGFAFVVSALKALLEHGIALGLVADAHPAGP